MDRDFLDWDNDLDLDYLLGDYTDYDDILENGSDSDFANEDSAVTNTPASRPKEKNLMTYDCPVCGKTFKSISGFRGHVVKKHKRTDLRAIDHRSTTPNTVTKEMVAESTTKENQNPKPVKNMIDDNFQTYFDAAYDKAIEDVKSDDHHNCGESLYGKNIVFLAEIIEKEESGVLRNAISENLKGVFNESNAIPIQSSMREHLINKLHCELLSMDSLNKYQEIICGCCQIPVSLLCFLNAFLCEFILNVVSNFLDERKKCFESKAVEVNSTSISSNDQNVLFYICGYILKSIKRRNKKSEASEILIDNLCARGGNSKMIKQFSSWTEKLDRGGLTYPSDNFFLMIRHCEETVQRVVTEDRPTPVMMKTEVLTEKILDNAMVKYYWDIMSRNVPVPVAECLLERCISLFLTIRGFAVAKKLRKERESLSKESVKGQKGLRKSLKSMENTARE